MNDFSKAADIADAVGAFFADKEFGGKLEGKNMFTLASMMLRDYPDRCINLICAYFGIDKSDANFDGKELYSKMITALKNTMEVFQHFE